MLTNIKSLPSLKYFHFPTAFRIISSTSQTLLSYPAALVPYPLTREATLINVYSLNTPNSFLPGRPLHMPVPFLEALPLPCTWKAPSLPSCLTLYIISSKSPSLDQIAEGGLWFCFLSWPLLLLQPWSQLVLINLLVYFINAPSHSRLYACSALT